VYQKLDFSRFENLENLDPDIMQYVDLYGEVREYQIPYHWGTTGVSWNVDLVRERLPDQPMDTLAVLFDPDIVSKLADCGVSLLDSPSDVLPMVMRLDGRCEYCGGRRTTSAGPTVYSLLRQPETVHRHAQQGDLCRNELGR
jgi:putrescine transport system substrate-binding protein